MGVVATKDDHLDLGKPSEQVLRDFDLNDDEIESLQQQKAL